MKKKLISAILCVALIFLVGCSAAPTQEPVVNNSVEINENIVDEIKSRGYLIVGCKTDVPELGCYNAKTKSFEGLEVDLAIKVASGIFGVTEDEVIKNNFLRIVGVTVADREEQLENGNVDLLFATYTITDERKQRFAISNSYYTDQIGIMVKSGKTDNETLGGNEIRSVADLDGKYIGVPRNATTREEFLNYLDTMNTVKVSPIFCEYESYEVLYNALQNGNIDAMAVDVSILKGYDTDFTKLLSIRFSSQSYGACAKLENQRLIDLVNDVIENK